MLRKNIRTNNGVDIVKTDISGVRIKHNPEWGEAVRNLKRDYSLYIMVIPLLAFLIVFSYMPLFGLQIAFKDYNLYRGIEESAWVGFDNFKHFFNLPDFARILRNTMVISVSSILIGFPIPIILALMFNEVKNTRFKVIGQTTVYLPYFISAVVIAGMVVNFLAPSGVINLAVQKLGGAQIYYLMRPEWFLPIYIFMTVWMQAGFNSIIYAAALAGIDQQLYEAAKIDGANRWKQLIHVTLPGISGTIITMLILRIGQMMAVSYENIILIYQPATFETADIINTYVYREGLVGGNYKVAVTAGMFNSVVSLVLVIAANAISRRVSETSLW